MEARQEDLILVIALQPSINPEIKAEETTTTEQIWSSAQGWVAIDEKVIEINAVQNGTQVSNKLNNILMCKAKLRLNFLLTHSFVSLQATVSSSRHSAPGPVNGCGAEETISWSVRTIKWFGVWVPADVIGKQPTSTSTSVMPEGEGSDTADKSEYASMSYRSLLCHLESSVDLCAEEINFSIAIDATHLTDNGNCTFI